MDIYVCISCDYITVKFYTETFGNNSSILDLLEQFSCHCHYILYCPYNSLYCDFGNTFILILILSLIANTLCTSVYYIKLILSYVYIHITYFAKLRFSFKICLLSSQLMDINELFDRAYLKNDIYLFRIPSV